MRKSVCDKDDKKNRKLPWLPQFDRMLIAGIKHGPSVKKDAIDKILQLAPQWTRGDCWRRVRLLRKTLGLALASERQPHDGGLASLKPGRHAVRPWTLADDDKLLNWAGYEPVRKIAQRLGRSVGAVRFRLGALGMSAKVKDGWSLRELRKLLRVSPARLKYLIGNGFLRVRDPRVTQDSLAEYCEKNRSTLDSTVVNRVMTVIENGGDAFTWERTADVLGVSLAQMQRLIASGHLKLVDLFVTERSFEEFCKKHGDEINMAIIDPDTAKWLISEYGVPDIATNGARVSPSRKHALVIRTCTCGRQIAGNPYFRHIRACRAAGGAATTQRSKLLDSSGQIVVSTQSPRSTKESASLRQSSKAG
jgi:hypothetical protein